MAESMTVGRYLVRRLEQCGLKHVFGIPGDYVLGFYELLLGSSMGVVGTCTEAGAAFAADAYARVNGLGAVCITYCVGGLNTINAVAGAYAEKSPLVVISGSPAMRRRVRSPLLHHRVKDFNTQALIFEQVTAATAVLNDPARAPAQIDQALAACLRTKRPVYIELPTDVCDRPCAKPARLDVSSPPSDKASLGEAVAEAAQMLRRARRPVILAGVEIHRFGLQDLLLDLVDKSGYPVAATLLGKSVISERHPQYLGIYEGAMGREEVRRAVESADCVLILGAFMTDINLGVFTAHLDVSRTINATSEQIAIKHHHFDGVQLGDFLRGLIRQLPRSRRRQKKAPAVSARPYTPRKSRPITVRRFFARMNEFLEDDFVVISDIGDSLFGAADLTIHRRTEFISPAYYTSMGFGIPAALGAQIRDRRLRPIVFVGDGAFQMTGMELSTIVRCGLNPIVFVLNNRGYTTERFIQDGPFNDIHEWSYQAVTQVLRGGQGLEVRTEGDLECSLAQARTHLGSFSIVNVHLDPYDKSDALVRLASRLANQ
ncbi:MAG: Indole-3-pyruvate decarboxylase [Planctomycetes bacterium ADurb.Bin126]|nr:MAG: Indole-3-pyruvate decarboxylase [Planctomycetes bacterium ADurb.Bin126]HOD82680.1 thiamine pyrophosphate-binding protein [Phycisphaerae bacterium]HQL73843.1 thiamine pyrophosphate-binding protein [Phycisphaerae bacterium]